jgi:HlyD family secretion protein
MMVMHKKRAMIPLALVLIITGAYAWYYYYGEGAASSNGRIEGAGTLEAVELNLGAQVAAKVVDVKVEEGAAVKKGDTLVSLDNRVLKDLVLTAQGGVEAAQATVDAADTSAELNIAKAQLKQAEASLSTARIQESYATIASPVDGVVLSLPITEGEVAAPGATMAVVGKLSSLELTIYVDQKELGRVNVGQKASVNVDAFSKKEFSGKVVEIASEAEFTPQNVQTKEQRSSLVFGVTVSVDNGSGDLKPGMPADAVLK